MFTLKIRTANDAFAGAPEMEVARILREVALQVERGGVRADGIARDSNGNTVGTWQMRGRK